MARTLLSNGFCRPHWSFLTLVFFASITCAPLEHDTMKVKIIWSSGVSLEPQQAPERMPIRNTYKLSGVPPPILSMGPKNMYFHQPKISSVEFRQCFVLTKPLRNISRSVLAFAGLGAAIQKTKKAIWGTTSRCCIPINGSNLATYMAPTLSLCSLSGWAHVHDYYSYQFAHNFEFFNHI